MLFIILFIPGCSARYDMYITENQLLEGIEVIGIETDSPPEQLRDSVARDYGLYYNITTAGDPGDCDNCNTKYVFGISGNRENDNVFQFRDSKLVKEYFGSVYISTLGSKYTIKGNPDKQLKSLLVDVNKVKALMDEISINIHVSYPVISNNANKVEGNTYTWIYNKDNTTQKIELVFDTTGKKVINNNVDNNNKQDEETRETVKLSKTNIYIIIGVVVVLIIGVGYYLIKKKQDNDRI